MDSSFNGTWRIDLERSTVWDEDRGAYVPDQIGNEVITLSIEDGVQDYEVLYGDDPIVRMGYTSRYDDPTWVPYLVRDIQASGDLQASVQAMRRRIKADRGSQVRHFEVGRPYGLVRTVYVDERTHYRISKSPETGEAQSVMMRKIAEDGNSYLASVLDTNGVVFRVRWFVRADERAPPVEA